MSNNCFNGIGQMLLLVDVSVKIAFLPYPLLLLLLLSASIV